MRGCIGLPLTLSLQSLFSGQWLVRLGVGLHPEAFVRPGSQINILATLTAARAVRIGRRVDAFALAGGAGDHPHARCLGILLIAQGINSVGYGMAVISGAQRQFKCAIVAGGVQAVVWPVAHEPDRHHQPVAADFGYQAQTRVHEEPQ